MPQGMVIGLTVGSMYIHAQVQLPLQVEKSSPVSFNHCPKAGKAFALASEKCSAEFPMCGTLFHRYTF